VTAPETKPPEVDPANYRTVLVGDVITGVGGAAFVTMIVGLVIYSAADDSVDRERGQAPLDQAALDEALGKRSTGLGLVIGGAAASAVLFTTGIALIVTGRKRERARRAKLNAMAPMPSFGPDHLGLSWGMHF
jgi:hypothetical protein